MSPDVILYHQALHELSRTARAFAGAVVHAAEAAARVNGDDDLITLRTFSECSAALVGAFAKAPAMIQLLTGRVG